MGRTTARRALAGVAAVAAVEVLALSGAAGPAQAVEPAQGSYAYTVPDPASPGAILEGAFFDLREFRGDVTVSGITWVSRGCGRLTADGAVSVNNRGKFRFKGMADGSGVPDVKIKFKGKFTSADKAKVTVKDLDPARDCGKLTGTAE